MEDVPTSNDKNVTPHLEDREYIKQAIAASCTRVEDAFNTLNARDFTGDPNHGITEQTLKCMLVAVLCTYYPDVNISSERTIDSGRLDLLLVRGTHAEVLELKYVRAGFLSFVKYSTNNRVFYANIKAALTKVRDHASPLDITYREKTNTRGLDRSARDLVASARSQATGYVNSLALGDIDPLPKTCNWTVGYHVICGIGLRVLNVEDRLVFTSTKATDKKKIEITAVL